MTTTADAFAEICVCALCRGALEPSETEVACTECGAGFPIRAGVLHLLPTLDSELERYVSNYEAIARADLEQPFEYDRETRHAALLDFIGDVRGKRVLDVGSSNGGYIALIDASHRTALDIAAPFLEAIPAATGVVRVCGDAENLPFRRGAFDVVIISDVLEHLLHPEKFVERLSEIATPETRVIVHVPWRENLAPYSESEYEFTHLRSFTDYTFARLWHTFRVVRRRSSYPSLEEPVVFQLGRIVPRTMANLLAWAYFHRGLGEREYAWRARWIAQLPRRERWLLTLYPPRFKLFELAPLRAGRKGYRAPLPGWLGSFASVTNRVESRIRRRRSNS